MKRGSALNRLLDYYFGIPLLKCLAWCHKRSIYCDRPDRIGILFSPALGDTLLASAAIQEVRTLYPDARLIAFVTQANASAASLIAGLDALEMLRITQPIRSIRMMRKCNLDLLFDFTAWQRLTAIYTLLSGAAYKVGFERVHQHRHCGYDMTVEHRGDCHELENLRRFTRRLGSQSSPVPRLSIAPGPVTGLVAHCDRIVVFHAWASGTRSWLREWPVASWIELAQRLKVPGRVFLLTGSPADEPRCASLLQTLLQHGVSARALIGRGGIDEIARALAHVELLVSVNTGIMHLGAILGVPTIALNGPTAVSRWGAVGPRVMNLSPSDGSGGFLDLGFEYRRHPINVMQKITPVQVLEAARQLVGESHLTASHPRQPSSGVKDVHKRSVEEAGEMSARLQAGDLATGRPWPA
jgi:heptosyltransferase III